MPCQDLVDLADPVPVDRAGRVFTDRASAGGSAGVFTGRGSIDVRPLRLRLRSGADVSRDAAPSLSARRR